MKIVWGQLPWMTIINAIAGLVTIAEDAFSGVPKSGAQKKELVTQATGLILSSAISASTGGQKEDLTQYAPAISGLIDTLAGMLKDDAPKPAESITTVAQ
jgi:hypothetical protein